MWHRAGLCVAFVLCAGVWHSDVQAQETAQDGTLHAQALDDKTSADMERAARALFQAGSVAFDQGRYEDALRHFSEAYKLAPGRHLLLYNIASSHDRLRQDREALSFFERYLDAETDPVNRPAVEARVKLLKEAVARADKAEAEKRAADAHAAEEERARQLAAEKQGAGGVAAQPPQEESRRRLSPIYTYVLGGVTVAALVAGGVGAAMAKSEQDAYDEYALAEANQTNFDQAQAHKDKGETLNTVAIAGFAAAGAAAVATAIIAGLFTDWSGDDSQQDKRPSASVWFGRGTAGVGVRHAF